MAKGNMLLGYSRGSVGDVVMSRVKGQQVAKARNRKPANPKSNNQMLQRSSFISPVKFFSHGVQALFKFAFDDKKITESDFNAFMRHNAKAAFPVTKAENDNPSFPALGNFMMTKGKLPEFPVKIHDDSQANMFVPIDDLGDEPTIGKLSQSFVNRGYAEVGDIITWLDVFLRVTSMSPTDIVIKASEMPTWYIMQFVVDFNDNRPVVEVLPHIAIESDGESFYMESQFGYVSKAHACYAATVIRSRETASDLEVSTSYLHNAGYVNQYIEYRKQKAQIDKVLADWGATGDAILQGSIAKK